MAGAGILGLSACSPAPGRIELFATTSYDRTLWRRTFDGGWGDWTQLGPGKVYAHAATSSADGRADLFTITDSGYAGHRRFERFDDGAGGYYWGDTGWETLIHVVDVTSDPFRPDDIALAAATADGETFDLFYISGNGQQILYHWRPGAAPEFAYIWAA